jgi:hypothetical protein
VSLLARFGKHFKLFYQQGTADRLQTFITRLDIVDTTTVYPFLLLCCDTLLPDNKEEFDRILTLLESFLFRRMICGLTSKNYNKIFLDLIRYVQDAQSVTAAVVAEFLGSSDGDSVRFPDDKEFHAAFTQNPLYQWLSQKKVRGILEALNGTLGHSKTEVLALPSGLTIEHLMPEKWEAHWPLPPEAAADANLEEQVILERNRLKHSIGNLTLITGSLNPSLSNSAWSVKKPELLKNSKLNLTISLHDAGEWGIEQIGIRANAFFPNAQSLWPALL